MHDEIDSVPDDVRHTNLQLASGVAKAQVLAKPGTRAPTLGLAAITELNLHVLAG